MGLITCFTSRCKVRCADQSRGTRWDGQKNKVITFSRDAKINTAAAFNIQRGIADSFVNWLCKTKKKVVVSLQGPSINDVTLFWAKIYPLPPCHISSQVFNPPSNITPQFVNLPPPYICNYKFPSILCLPRQKFSSVL